MSRKITKKNILLSFVGTNDAGSLNESKNDGAILTVFLERKYEEVHLLYNEGNVKDISYKLIAEHIKKELLLRKYCTNVFLHKIDLKSVTDHNEIYPSILNFCKTLPKDAGFQYTAAIASGTPAMQVCWILLAESGDYSIKLIRSNEPKFGKPYVHDVVLGAGLPRILKLQERIEELENDKNELLPDVFINISDGDIKIGNVRIDLSPIEFSYYRYFLEKAKIGNSQERFSGLSVSNDFLNSVFKYHKESFPEAELFRDQLQKMIKNKIPLSISTFRGNLSKTNKKITNSLKNPSLSEHYKINQFGKRHSTSYGVSVKPGKIKTIL